MSTSTDTSIADLLSGLKQRDGNGATRSTCVVPCAFNDRIDAIAAEVERRMGEQQAVIARMGEALDWMLNRYVATLGGKVVRDADEVIARAESLLASDDVTRVIEEHRAMVAELEARRTLDEECPRECARWKHDLSKRGNPASPCSCGLAARQGAARGVVDGYRAARESRGSRSQGQTCA